MRSKLSSRVLSVLLALVLVLSTLSTMAFAAGEKSDDVVVLYTNDVHCGVDAGTPKTPWGMPTWLPTNTPWRKQEQVGEGAFDHPGEAQGPESKGREGGAHPGGPGPRDFGKRGGGAPEPCGPPMLEKPAGIMGRKKIRGGTRAGTGGRGEILENLKVAYVGVSTPRKPSPNPPPTYFQDENGNYIYSFCEGNDGQDLYNAVQGAIDAATEAGADVVIAIGHCGIDEQSSPWTSREIIANTTGLDAFIDGHPTAPSLASP